MLKAFMTVSGLTLVSRVLGLLRDVVINHYLGVSYQADAWNSAFQFPNLFRRVFGEGAFNAAFIPMYSERLGVAKKKAFLFASNVILWLSLMLAFVFLGCTVFVDPIMKFCNIGYNTQALDLTISLARITMGYLVFVCLLAAFSAVLNAHKKFFAPAFSYAFLNIGLLSGLWLFMPIYENPERILVWSLLIAGAVQLLVVVLPVYKMGFRLVPGRWRWNSDMKQLWVLMIPGLLSAGIQQLNLLVGGLVVSFQEGGKTMIYNADRINQLPLGLIGIAYGVVLLPEISRLVKQDQYAQARASLQMGMVHAMFLTFPAMVGMAVLAEPILFVIFKSGKFTSEAAIASGYALSAFALGCPAYVLARILQPGYFARGDTKTPMLFTGISAFINVVLCFLALAVMRDSGMLHVGCAAATSVAGWINALLLALGLRKHQLISLSRHFWKRMAKMFIAGIIMGIGIWWWANMANEALHSESRLGRTSVLLLIIGGGISLYFLLACLLNVMSLNEIKKGFRLSRK